jgi:gamma-glutamyl:cysteine ligase YbdK (ATP-grasp superfamily)
VRRQAQHRRGGGGTHPFQQWHQQRIYDKPRFQQLSQLYGYLSKQFTIFGQHVHIGCPDADTALYTLHGMSATSRTSSRWRPPAPSCRGRTRPSTRPG